MGKRIHHCLNANSVRDTIDTSNPAHVQTAFSPVVQQSPSLLEPLITSLPI